MRGCVYVVLYSADGRYYGVFGTQRHLFKHFGFDRYDYEMIMRRHLGCFKSSGSGSAGVEFKIRCETVY